MLMGGQGNPGKAEHLFKVVGEKLPFEALAKVKKNNGFINTKPRVIAEGTMPAK